MTPDQARKSVKRARDRLARDTSNAHERYRRSLYRVQAACTHDWRELVGVYDQSREWECCVCGVVSKKNQTKGLA